MKGESREAKGHKSTGDGRTWHGKRETLTSLSPPTEIEFCYVLLLRSRLLSSSQIMVFPATHFTFYAKIS